jgi:hypothetical protein
MKLLGKSPDDPLTPAIAQEIGVREGDKAYITGSIAKLGEAYIISVTAVNPLNQDTIVSAQVQAASKDKVLDALNDVSADMRHKLGESLRRLKSSTCRSGQANTPSLDRPEQARRGLKSLRRPLRMQPASEGERCQLWLRRKRGSR